MIKKFQWGRAPPSASRCHWRCRRAAHQTPPLLATTDRNPRVVRWGIPEIETRFRNSTFGLWRSSATIWHVHKLKNNVLASLFWDNWNLTGDSPGTAIPSTHDRLYNPIPNRNRIMAKAASTLQQKQHPLVATMGREQRTIPWGCQKHWWAYGCSQNLDYESDCWLASQRLGTCTILQI